MSESILTIVKQRACIYARLTRLHNPVGIWLLLWPVLWSLWLAAEGTPRPAVLFVFVAGVILMRSAGCAINDFADRDIDPLVARTKTRPLAAREIKPAEALAVFAALSLVAFALVLTLQNTAVILMSVPGLLLAATYPLMKRFFHLPQAYLGIAFSWGIPMAWIAQTGEWPSHAAWLLFCASVFFTLAYDTIYAIADYADDQRANIKSSAILFGSYAQTFVGFFQLTTVALLLFVGYLKDLGLWYHLGVVVAFALFAHQHLHIKERDPRACIAAFKNNAWVGGVIFVALLIEYL